MTSYLWALSPVRRLAAARHIPAIWRAWDPPERRWREVLALGWVVENSWLSPCASPAFFEPFALPSGRDS